MKIEIIETCNNCNQENIEGVKNVRTKSGEANLCKLCYNTFFSSAIIYPRENRDSNLYQAIAYAFNEVLKELKGVKNELGKLKESIDHSVLR